MHIDMDTKDKANDEWAKEVFLSLSLRLEFLKNL